MVRCKKRIINLWSNLFIFFLLQLDNWSPKTWLFEMLSSTSWEGETSRVLTCPSGCLLHKKQVLLPSDIKLTDYFPHVLQHKIWVLTKARMVGQTRTFLCCSLDWAEAPAGPGSHSFAGVSAWPAASLQREFTMKFPRGKRQQTSKVLQERNNDRNIAPVQCFPWKTEDYFLLR